MEIPLQIRDFAGGLRAMAHILINSKEIGRLVPVEAIFDTGSPETILGLIDLKKMRISPLRFKNLEGKKRSIHMGGGEVKTQVLDGVELIFGEHFKCVMPIHVPVEEVSGTAQSTILGVDFLIKNNFKFVFDPNNKEAHFERPD